MNSNPQWTITMWVVPVNSIPIFSYGGGDKNLGKKERKGKEEKEKKDKKRRKIMRAHHAMVEFWMKNSRL